jgi:oligopeptide/dipeptide ABC transporter ATP-binding protein
VTALLEVSQLGVEVQLEGSLRPVLRDITFTVAAGEALAVVGESGSGKSMTARAIGRLLPPGSRTSGDISFAGEPVLTMSPGALRSYRTDGIGMIFQDPRASINPVLPVGDFLTEPLRTLRGMSRQQARARVVELLDDVGVSRPEARLRQFPHELSGGLLQRVMIAAVLAMEPRLVLADEPTTALDVTTQSDVMSILDDARRDRGMGLVLITHDLELAAAVCDRTLVMYGGRIMEDQASARMHDAPLHPYTAALLASRPSLTLKPEYLEVIPGRPLSAVEAPHGCPFADRCALALERCSASAPVMRPLHGGRTSCIRAETLAPSLAPAAGGSRG